MLRWVWWLSLVCQASSSKWLGWLQQFTPQLFPQEISLANVYVTSSTVLSYQTYLCSSFSSLVSVSRSELYLNPSDNRQLATALRLMPSTQVVVWSGEEDARLNASLQKFLPQLLTVKAPLSVLFVCSASFSSKWVKSFHEIGYDVFVEATLVGRRTFFEQRDLWVFRPINFDSDHSKQQRDFSDGVLMNRSDEQAEYREILKHVIRPINTLKDQCEDTSTLKQQQQQQQQQPQPAATSSSTLAFDEAPPVEFISGPLATTEENPPTSESIKLKNPYVRADALAHLLAQKDFEALEDALLFNLQQTHSLSIQQRTEMFESFLSLLSNPSFSISKERGPKFLDFHLLITNLITQSEFDIDGLFRTFSNIPIWNFLTLFSPICTSWVDISFLYEENAYAFISWFQIIFKHLKSGMLAFPTGYLFFEKLLTETANLQGNFVGLPYEDLDAPKDVHLLNQVFFGATYIPHLNGEVNDMPIKQRINNYLQHLYPSIQQWPSLCSSSSPPFVYKPEGSLLRVGVISGSWLEGHSVYRNFAQATHALSQDEHIELSLIFLGEKSSSQQVMTEHFFPHTSSAEETQRISRVKYIGWESHKQLIDDANWIASQEFDVLFYPDLGMTAQSLLLGNKRLAKGIQIASYGHSASTQGALIDYWIGGSEVELIENDTSAYSETLVILPGLGITHNQPLYVPSMSTNLSLPETFILTLSWSLPKLNYPHLLHIKQILLLAQQYNDQHLVSRKYLVRFLLINADNARDTLIPELKRQFAPFEVEVQTSLVGGTYLQMFQEGHLFLGSHPYGDCNTVLDALAVGVPLVLWEGREWRNRIGSAMLRRAGLSKFVAQTVEEYISKAVKMLTDHMVWSKVAEHVRSLDLATLFYDSEDLLYYPSLFRYLYHNHSLISENNIRVLQLN